MTLLIPPWGENDNGLIREKDRTHGGNLDGVVGGKRRDFLGAPAPLVSD